MAVHTIDAADDPRLESYRLVQDRDRAGTDSRPGLFVGETPVVVQAMLEQPGCTRSILAARNRLARVEAMLAHARAAWPPETAEPDVYAVPESLVEPLTGFNVHRGLLAIGVRPAPRSVASLVPAQAGPATLLCIEGVNNMDNIGQLFRVAAAFACDGVVLSRDCHDPFYRKSLRVSCGCALRVPFARAHDWHGELRALREAHRLTLVGATGHGLTTLAAVARDAPRRIAVIVGAEFAGLAAETLELCDHQVRIPMAAGVDSLNVGIAAAVLLERLSQGSRR